MVRVCVHFFLIAPKTKTTQTKIEYFTFPLYFTICTYALHCWRKFLYTINSILNGKQIEVERNEKKIHSFATRRCFELKFQKKRRIHIRYAGTDFFFQRIPIFYSLCIFNDPMFGSVFLSPSLLWWLSLYLRLWPSAFHCTAMVIEKWKHPQCVVARFAFTNKTKSHRNLNMF